MPGLFTPLSSIMIDPTGERTIVTFRDPGLWKVKLPDADTLLANFDAVLTENRCAEFVTGPVRGSATARHSRGGRRRPGDVAL